MGAARPRIVVAERLSEPALAKLRDVGDVSCLERCDEQALCQSVVDCDALVVRSYAQVSTAVLAAAPHLKVIGRAGIGVENIDVASAQAAGITVVYTPAASTQAVAELTIGLMIALERRVVWAQAELRQDRFVETRGALAQRQMGAMCLGIIGFGRIGQRVAQIAHAAFGMEVLFNDLLDIRTHTFPARAVSKESVYAECDVVSLHVPLTALTRHMIDESALAQMNSETLLINTARGAVVDGHALARALQAGAIGGAAVDVFEPEPPTETDPLLAAPNCILTPHIASRTRVALDAMNSVVDDVIAVLQGRPVQYPVAEDVN